MWDLKKYGSSAAFKDDNASMTYLQLDSFCNEFYNCIASRCLVAIICTSSVACAAGYTACIQKGVVPIMINSGQSIEYTEKILSTYKPEYIWKPESTFVGDDGGVFEFGDYVLVRYSYEKCRLNDELALVLTTSGSTGSCRLVRLSSKNIASNMLSICSYLEICENDRAMLVLPLYYSYGLSVVNTYLYSGASIVFTKRKFYTEAFWKYAREQRATSFSGVPYHFEMIYKLGLLATLWESVKTCTVAGGKLNGDAVKRIALSAQGSAGRFFVMYGQTEATARISFLPWQSAVSKCESCGISIPGGSLRLFDDGGGQITDCGVKGRIVYSGENVGMGYAESPQDLALEDINGGVLDTNDMGYFDEDGYLYICGRCDRYVKLYGMRINLDEIQDITMKNFSVSEVACFGEENTVYIAVCGADASPNDIAELVSEKTHFPSKNFKVVSLDEIPHLANGKPDYRALNSNVLERNSI